MVNVLLFLASAFIPVSGSDFRVEFPGKPTVREDPATKALSYSVKNADATFELTRRVTIHLKANAQSVFAQLLLEFRKGGLPFRSREFGLGATDILEVEVTAPESPSLTRLYFSPAGVAWQLTVRPGAGKSPDQVGAFRFFDSFVPGLQAGGPVEVIGWSLDGSKLVILEHDADPTDGAFASVTFYETSAAKPVGTTIDEVAGTEAQAVQRAREKIGAELRKRGWPALVPGRSSRPASALQISLQKVGASTACTAGYSLAAATVTLTEAGASPVTLRQGAIAEGCISRCEIDRVITQGSAALIVLTCAHSSVSTPQPTWKAVPIVYGRLGKPL